ncbi:Flp family type IVb pilin [Sphingorhabdus sp.]|uniref:Flp family type IVb pilin n=1 Tax=Sphingorhabdus sp. TaxID=1902408 RepID=UPI0037C5E1D6
MPATKDRRRTNKMLDFIRRIQKCNQGATAVEYGLIVTLIIIAMIPSLGTVANGIQDVLNKVSNELSTS